MSDLFKSLWDEYHDLYLKSVKDPQASEAYRNLHPRPTIMTDLREEKPVVCVTYGFYGDDPVAWMNFLTVRQPFIVPNIRGCSFSDQLKIICKIRADCANELSILDTHRDKIFVDHTGKTYKSRLCRPRDEMCGTFLEGRIYFLDKEIDIMKQLVLVAELLRRGKGNDDVLSDTIIVILTTYFLEKFDFWVNCFSIRCLSDRSADP
jgi:hypothetical protein